MRPLLFFLFFAPAFLLAQTTAQRHIYDSLVVQGHEAFVSRAYPQAAQLYLEAFRALGDRGFSQDRYEATQALAQAVLPEPAFDNLYRLRDKTTDLDYTTLLADTLLRPLHPDMRWAQLLATLRPELPELAQRLARIQRLDQDLRKTLPATRAQFGAQSAEMKALWEKISLQDSINLLDIKQILDTFGWPGPKQVGHGGNKTVWLVIQHAGLAEQEQYLPLLRAAADEGKATCGNLAYLEDRILVRKKQKQLYASQQFTPNTSNETWYYPVEDPDNLNIRRAGMGMSPLSDKTIEELKKPAPTGW
ncbi:MAG: hypothetical protein IT260_23385 [Saprospiraceae bacterium]|nr:hypothetical protein [Saprospiraceae bacterium]